MTSKDHQIIFTALGFLAVILRDDLPMEKQGARATSLAKLIEAFCQVSVPDAFMPESFGDNIDTDYIDDEIYRYKTALRTKGSADLSHDREALIRIYDRLLVRKSHYERREFYHTSHDDVIANQVLRLVEEEIEREERAAP